MKLASIQGDGHTLLNKLNQLRTYIVASVQPLYDEWDQEIEPGGLCDQIAETISGVLGLAGIDCTNGGHDGDDHAYVIAYDDLSSYLVDIPYDLYETGGGYNWTKIEGVQFEPADVVIEPVQRPDWI